MVAGHCWLARLVSAAAVMSSNSPSWRAVPEVERWDYQVRFDMLVRIN